jgi:pimeloyl-ACP methyl ester carboxylesterase
MMCDARVFGPQIEDLSRDFALHIAQVAHGESIREMAAEAIYNAPPRFALVGLSMGGIVAMEILRRVPDRVTRLALMSTTPLAETPQQAAWRETQIVKAQAGQLEQAMREALPPEALASGESRPRTLAVIDAMARDLGVKTFLRHSRALQRRPDAQKVLVTARLPTLIVAGAQDALTPVKRARFMAELMPNAELVEVPEAGHIPTLETPEAVNAALRALMERPLAAGR